MTRARPVVAIYPGSFDPLTKGHEDIARRSLRLADQVVVAVAYTPTQAKGSLFSVEERLEMMVAAAEDELSDEQRELFRLHHLEHRPIKEIAGRLNKTENSIKSNLYRTRKILLAE